MLTKLEIQNFQAHSNSAIELAPGVNVIRGSSDNGKSSLIRAIYWALFNRPTGTGFFSWGKTDPTLVRLFFTDGAIVLREKDKKNNFYMRRVNETDNNRDKFQALRTDVPTEISDVHKLETFNVQRQHDRYFLLQDSPGEVGRLLNEVANLNIIGETITAANKYISAKKAVIGQLVAENQSLENQLHTLPPIEQILPHIESCREKVAILNELQHIRAQISIVYESYKKAKATLAGFPDISVVYKHLSVAAAICTEIQQKVQLYGTVEPVFQKYEKNRLANNALPDIEKIAGLLSAVETNLPQVKTKREHAKAIFALYGKYRATTKQIADTSRELLSVEAHLNTIRKTRPVCPLCNQPWTAP